jgi:demethylmenaquinone methyltransferase/2-methoxy-6-polyprenyl-1,4-benzoquinol methylase
MLSKNSYKWFYDHIHSRYYDLVMKWCYLPFGGEEECRKEVIAHIDFSSGERILDMCCGTGGATFAIARRAKQDSQIVGVDLSSGQIRSARKKNNFANVKFIEGDVTNAGFEDACFHKVFITHALHEMTREDRLRVLTEAWRILKDEGEVVVLEVDNPPSSFVRLFIALWFFYWLPFNFETPTRRDMLRHGLINELKATGFKKVRKVSKYRGIFQIVQGVK